jgi:NAD(P)-dependent dehydrogenase (short-subunit alcohol dehydrogenase family)
MTSLTWRGKTALLTGIGRKGQVGEAVAAAFAEQGADLVILGRDADELTARTRELEAFGTSVHAHAVDLTDPAALTTVVADVGRHSPAGLAAFVHVAGGFASSGAIAESDPDVYQQQIAVNLTTTYLATRAFLPLVRTATGSIVFFASAAVLPGGSVAQIGAYAAAKSGVVALMRAVAQEEKGSGVRSNALAPTSIRTSANLAAMGDATRYVERETVAAWVLFLCSPNSGPITGQVIRLG